MLDQADMIEEFERAGFTAIPHPYIPGGIAMPLHHKVEAQYLADYHGWEWASMGWAPRAVVKKCIMPRGARMPKDDEAAE